jgi:hypothetical protein
MKCMPKSLTENNSMCMQNQYSPIVIGHAKLI